MTREAPRTSPRNPTAIVQPNLRIRESLRRRIEQAARQNAVSLNREMIARLEASFQRDALRTIEAVAADMKKMMARVQQGGAG